MWRVIKWLLILAFSAIASFAGDSAIDRATLKGLTALRVVVDSIPPELEQLGVAQDELQKQVTDRLREIGLAANDQTNDFLGVQVQSAQAGRSRKSPFAVTIVLAAYQLVTLNRDRGIRAVAPTWSADTIFIAQPRVLEGMVRGGLAQLVDHFAAAYRSVNPK